MVAIIGCGKMGSALVEGAVRAGRMAASDLLLFDVVPEASRGLAERIGAIDAPPNGVATIEEAVAGAEVVLVCVKPADIDGVLAAVDASEGSRLVVSIVAGVALSRLESLAGGKARVVRVMPNTPALVGRGASAYALGTRADEADADFVEGLLGAVGTVRRVKESLMDAVTGLSGSGPAFVYTVIEALADGGVRCGLPRDAALELAATTVAGAAEMVLSTGQHPAVLRDQVTSPGGTTIAGLAELEACGLRSALIEAVSAAARRSAELGG